jgi:hypothetical protein
MKRSIWIGFDSREVPAFVVTVHSIRQHLSEPIPISGIVMKDLADSGLYRRPTEERFKADRTRVLIDKLSAREDYDGAISTEFAISRFFTPLLAGSGMAAFLDCDMLVRYDMARAFAHCSDPSKAVWCVKHLHQPSTGIKMDGQVQTAYHRKNWSSVMIFNCDHPSNKRLTLDMLNSVPGRDLHAFCWLDDDEIGELPATWNWLAGEQEKIPNPHIVHHTLGSPCLPGYENAPYAREWNEVILDYGVKP